MAFTAKKTVAASKNLADQRDLELSRERTRARDEQEAATRELQRMASGFSFGRVNESRPQEIQDIINRRKALSEQGLNAQEYQALRQSRLGGLRSANVGQMRQARAQAARYGLAGPAAAQNMNNLLAQQQRARQEAEQALLLENVAQRQQGLQGYESSLSGARADELARQQYNMGLTGREMELKMAPQYLAAQLAGQRYGNVSQQQLAEQARRDALRQNQQEEKQSKGLFGLGFLGL